MLRLQCQGYMGWTDMGRLAVNSSAPKRIWTWSDFAQCLAGTWGVTRYPSYAHEYILAAEHARLMAGKNAEIARLRENMRNSYEAFCSMRNDLNEIVGDMISQEATLMDGPTMWAECAAVVEAVARYHQTKLAEAAAIRALKSDTTA